MHVALFCSQHIFHFMVCFFCGILGIKAMDGPALEDSSAIVFPEVPKNDVFPPVVGSSTLETNSDSMTVFPETYPLYSSTIMQRFTYDPAYAPSAPYLYEPNFGSKEMVSIPPQDPFRSSVQENQQQLALPSDQRYVVLTEEQFGKMMEMMKEQKELTQSLLMQGDRQVEVLERVEQGQEQLKSEVDRLKGTIVKVSEQLSNTDQTTFQRVVNWGSVGLKAGFSVATGLTTYSAIVPALSILPAVVAPPLAVPAAIATYAGFRLFSTLV